MTRPRAQFQDYCMTRDSANVLSLVRGATVHIYELGTTTHIADTIYANISDDTVKSNPFTADDNGYIEFYLDTARPVKIVWTFGIIQGTKEVAFPVTINSEVNLLAAGAKGDGSTDDTEPFQEAIDHLGSRGGGILTVPPSPSNMSYRLTGPVYCPYNNIVIQSQSRTQDLILPAPTLFIDHEVWPAFWFGGGSGGQYCMIRDLSIMMPASPTTTHTVEGQSDFGAMILADQTTRFRVENVRIPFSMDAIAVGTKNNPLGSNGTEIVDCELWFERDGVIIRRSPYLNVNGVNRWECRSGLGSGLKFIEDAFVDGGLISDLFTEDCAYAIDCQIAGVGASLAEVIDMNFTNLMLDGCKNGAWKIAVGEGGRVAKWNIDGGRNTGLYLGPTLSVGNGWEISTTGDGTVQELQVFGGVTTTFGYHGIYVRTPATSTSHHSIRFFNHIVQHCSQNTGNTYDGVHVETGNYDFTFTGQVEGQYPVDLVSNRHMRYGVAVEPTCDRFEIDSYVSGVGTAAYLQGSPHDGITRFWRR